LTRTKTIKEKLLYLSLEKTTKKIRELFNNSEALKSNELSLEQWLIIELVGKNEGINQKKIIEILSKEPASVSRMVKKLTNRQLIERKADKMDKKIVHLYLSDKGQEIYTTFKKSVDNTFKNIFSSIFERELYLVIDILKRVE